MKRITRRSFLRSAAKATLTAAMTPALSSCWSNLAQTKKTEYFETEFGITDSQCRRVLAEALSKGGDFADLYFEHTLGNWVILEDGKVNRAYSNVALGVGIRTVKGDQVGYGFTQELTMKSMMAAASTAATINTGNGSHPSGTPLSFKKR